MNWMRYCRRYVARALTTVVALSMVTWNAALADEALPHIVVSVGLKILSMQKQFNGRPDGITVFVLDDANVAKAFQASINAPVGTMKVARVLSGSDLPTEKPDVLFIGGKEKLEAAVAYTRSQKVLSMARNDKFISRGVTLTVYQTPDGKPQITMNMSGALLEGVDVNPATLKVAKATK